MRKLYLRTLFIGIAFQITQAVTVEEKKSALANAKVAMETAQKAKDDATQAKNSAQKTYEDAKIASSNAKTTAYKTRDNALSPLKVYEKAKADAKTAYEKALVNAEAAYKQNIANPLEFNKTAPAAAEAALKQALIDADQALPGLKTEYEATFKKSDEAEREFNSLKQKYNQAVDDCKKAPTC